MCRVVTYRLLCEHIYTETQPCVMANYYHAGQLCEPLTRETRDTETRSDIRCPITRCPFEVKRRCWNCCWCGKEENRRGRCSSNMIGDAGVNYRCDHICCRFCEAADT